MAAWTLDAIPDQSGRLVVVTGANSGIGYVTARELARRGAHVVLACRSADRGRVAVQRMRAEVPDARLDLRALDLGDLASIRAFAEGWDHDRLDLLVNNAGVAVVPFARTVDGFESHFGINHLGPFALTGRLLPALRAAEHPRVVTVASEGHQFARFDLTDVHAERRYRPGVAYTVSKRANVYFAAHLQRWADAAGLRLTSVVVAPGLTRTEILTGGAHRSRSWLYHALVGTLVRTVFRPTPAGARTSLLAATMPDVPPGSYVAPRGPLQFYGRPAIRRSDKVLTDVAPAEQLWRLSEELTGVRFAA